jgi:putative membrane protein
MRGGAESAAGPESVGVSGKLDSNQLAAERTWLANERTLMAWVRTATAMISFGFTIFKFFEFEAARNADVHHGWLTPRNFARILVGIALTALVAAILQYRRALKRLKAQLEHKRLSAAEIVAALVAGFGILVWLSAIIRSW